DVEVRDVEGARRERRAAVLQLQREIAGDGDVGSRHRRLEETEVDRERRRREVGTHLELDLARRRVEAEAAADGARVEAEPERGAERCADREGRSLGAGRV